MPRTVTLHDIHNLAHESTNNEILLSTKLNTELHIIAKHEKTIIKLPFGNKFDIVDGMIIIWENK